MLTAHIAIIDLIFKTTCLPYHSSFFQDCFTENNQGKHKNPSHIGMKTKNEVFDP